MESGLSRLSKIMAPEFGNAQPSNDRYRHIFQFFGLRENPFNVNPDPRYLSFTRQTQEAFDVLTYGIQSRQGLILLTGEVGTGKTTLLNHLLNWLKQREAPTAFIFNSRLNVGDLFDFIVADFGIARQSTQKANKRALLTEWLLWCYRAGKTPILIVDEAQGLPLPALEEIRLLLNLETSQEKLLQIVLVGQPELEEKLNRPELRQLRQRVVVRCKVGPLNSAETRAYVQRRLQVAGAQGASVFLPDAMDALHLYSCGIPRVINILSEHALINAYADQIPSVSAQIVKEVAQEFQFDEIRPLDAQSNFNETQNARAITPRSISTIVRVQALELAKPASTERRDASMKHVPVPAVEKCTMVRPDKPLTTPVMNHVGIANSEIDNRVAGRRPLTPSPHFSRSSYLWHRCRDKSKAMINFTIVQHAGSSVTRWLTKPVGPLYMRRRIEQRLGSSHLWRKITSARFLEDVRQSCARIWHHKKARIES